MLKEEQIGVASGPELPAVHALLAMVRRVRFIPAHKRGLIWFIAAFSLCWCAITLLAWGSWWPALFAYLLTLVCLRGSLEGLPRHATFAPPGSLAVPSRMPLRNAGIALCILATLASLWAAKHLADSPYVGWSLLIYPLALLAAWCGEGWARSTGGHDLHRAVRAHWLELLILLGIVLAGLLMRLWLALQYPLIHGTVHDEGLVALQAWQMAHGTAAWPLYVTMGGAVALFQPLAAIFAVTDPSMTVFRLSAIPLSVSLIPAFYVLARQVVAPAPALCAAGLLSLAYWPAAIGALAFGWIAGSVFQCLGLALLLYGLRRQRFTACAAAGMVLALCLYSYSSHRTMPIPALVLLLLFLVSGPGPLVRRLGLCLSFLAGFGSVAAPWIGLAIGNHNLVVGDSQWVAHEFFDKLPHQPLAALNDAFGNAFRLCAALMARPIPEGYTFDVVPGGGLFDHLSTTLMLLGLGSALLRWRQPLNLTLLVALLTPIPAAAVVISQLSDVYRMNGVVPALFLALALALSQAFVLACQARIRMRYVLVGLLVVALTGGAANANTMQSYLASDTTLCGEANILNDVGAEGIVVADETNSLRPQQEVYLVSSWLEEWAWAWLFRGPLPGQVAPSGAKDPAHWPVWISQPVASAGSVFWPPHLAPGKTGVTYFMTDRDASRFLPIVQRGYPGGRIRVFRPERCGYLFHLTAYSLTAGQLTHAPLIVRP